MALRSGQNPGFRNRVVKRAADYRTAALRSGDDLARASGAWRTKSGLKGADLRP